MIQNRSFLEQVIPKLDLPAAAETTALEYGCGTGPAACFLAARGFQVDAIDLIPEAITLARRMAEDRGVRVAFSVADICALASEPATRRYDIVLDSYYREVPAGAVADHVVEINGRRHIPHRRHLSADALRDELVSAGFQVLSLESSDTGDVVCRLDPS